MPEKAWYAGAAQWAFEAGLMVGTEVGRFQGEAPVTREQMVCVLWRYAGAEAASGGVGFTDGEAIAAYAREAVAWAADGGIVSGFPDGRFAPRESVTRAQAAVVFAKLDKAMEVKEGPMEWALEKAERYDPACDPTSHSFTRYPGKLGTAYFSAECGNYLYLRGTYPGGTVCHCCSFGRRRFCAEGYQ